MKPLKTIKISIWVRVREDIGKIRDRLNFFLEFHRLQNKVDEYLKSTEKEVHDRNGIK